MEEVPADVRAAGEEHCELACVDCQCAMEEEACFWTKLVIWRPSLAASVHPVATTPPSLPCSRLLSLRRLIPQGKGKSQPRPANWRRVPHATALFGVGTFSLRSSTARIQTALLGAASPTPPSTRSLDFRYVFTRCYIFADRQTIYPSPHFETHQLAARHHRKMARRRH